MQAPLLSVRDLSVEIRSDLGTLKAVDGLSFDIPILNTVDPWAVLLSIAAMIAIFRFKIGMIPTLLACSATGFLLYLAGLIQ